jgi:hypothetical protein
MPMPTPEEVKQWIEVEGRSMNSLASKCGCNVGGLSAMVKRLGLISRHVDQAKQKTDLDGATLAEQYRTGVSLHQLMKQTNRPIKAIKKAISKADPSIEFRSREDALRPGGLNDSESLEKYAQSGKTARQIAAELGVKEKTVTDAYKRLNISRYKKPTSIVIPEAELRKLYTDDGLSSIVIASMFGTSAGRVCALLKQYGIERRGFGKMKDSKYDKLNDRDWLFEHYITKSMSAADIQRLIGCQGAGTITHALRKNNIPLRSKDEVYEKLQSDSHGHKIDVIHRGEIVRCGSLGEAEFLKYASDNGLMVTRATLTLKHKNHSYRPDFIIDDSGVIVEVKPKSQIVSNGHDRNKLMRQYMVATAAGRVCKAWAAGQFYDLSITELDKYYALAWDLVFDTPRECFDWLVKFGFAGALRSHGALVSGLKRYEAIAKDPHADLLDSSLNAVDTLWLMRHFHPHYFHSTHTGYKPVSAAFEIGNQTVLMNALVELWKQNRHINIYSLLHLISKRFVDFAMVSLFKPWVARAVYQKLLPEGGTIVDPCAGWGGRVFGTLDLPVVYRGFDINQQSVDGNNSLIKFLGAKRVQDAIVEQADSSRFQFPESDLLFTSPPYFGLEEYHGAPEQDTTAGIIDNVFRQRSSKIVALNVSNKMVKTVVEHARKHKYKYADTMLMQTRQYMAMRKKVTEPILVFERR